MDNKRYLKVMFGNKSSANGFEYKINEVNVADNWKHNEENLKDMGGFYVLAPHGVFLANKIILRKN